MTFDFDVVIAGAGPVGLFLACELRLARVSVVVLEQAKDPESPLKRAPFGLRGLWGPSIEAFHRRGLLERIAAGTPSGNGAGLPKQGSMTPSPGRRGPAGHFAGIQFDYANIDASRWTFRIPGPGDTLLGAEMAHIERVLTEQALSLGVEVRRGQGVDDFEDDGDGVTVRSGEQRVRARYLVGCDGGRSTVRKRGGFSFVGTEPEFPGYAVQVEMEDPSVLPMGRHHTQTGTFTQWDAGYLSIGDFDGGAFHRKPITREHIEGVLRRVSGTDVAIKELKLASTFTDRSFQATTYRRGRVLLAGDAAHVHSPLGGQGLNLGLGDAMNLGWKLAASVRGDAPSELLDTYTTERHPVGARILEWTRAQVTLMRPDPRSRALFGVMRDLVGTRDGATYVAERVWGVSIRYDLGDPRDLVGRSCPDFELADGTRAGTRLREGKALLLDFDGSLRGRTDDWSDRVTYVGLDAKERLGGTAVLVRPDGFVAWASDGAPNADEVTEACTRWFGPRRG